MTPLEKQILQSREYSQSKDVVFAGVMSVFQDLGYTVTNASKDTGLISAESAAKSDLHFNLMFGTRTLVTQTKATAFIERIKEKTRVRLNFVLVNKQSSVYGQSDRADTPLLDAKLYQNAFEKIESAIFLRSN